MTQANNPLNGLTLETIVTKLVQFYGYTALAIQINIRCFKEDQSIKTSIKFLRKTEWARAKLEELYLNTRFEVTNSPWSQQ